MEKPFLNIGMNSIVRECNLPSIYQDYHFRNMNYSSYKNIHEVFRYRKFGDDFGDFFTVYLCEDGTWKFRPSYDELITKVAYFLNTKLVPPIADDSFEQVCLEQIEVLKNIKDIETLKNEFPAIYQDFIDGRDYMDKLRNEKDILSSSEYREKEHYYYSCALQYNLEHFISKQVEFYRRLVQDRGNYLELCQRKSANRYLNDYFDQEKLRLLVVTNCVEMCEKSDNLDFIKETLPIIENYLNSQPDYSTSIMTDDWYCVDYGDLYFRYKALKERLEVKDSFVYWELVPDGISDLGFIKQERKPRVSHMSQKEVDRLQKMGQEKMAFFENSHYIARVVGSLKYKGYVGYIYENGSVLLEREYNPSSVSTASGNAIFHMSAEDFMELSCLDKSQLADHPRVQRIIHSKKWMERVRDIIDREGLEEEKEQASSLVKKLEHMKKRN